MTSLPDANQRPLAVSIVDAAQYIGVGRSTVYELVADGQLEARKLGGRTLILMGELERFLQNLPTADALNHAADLG